MQFLKTMPKSGFALSRILRQHPRMELGSARLLAAYGQQGTRWPVIRIDTALRVVLTLTLVISIAVFSNLRSCWMEIKEYRAKGGLDRTARYDLQMKKLRALLPGEGTVGFVADRDPELALSLAQYGLSPVFVRPGINHRLIVADFTDPSRSREFQEENRLVLIRRLDEQIALFERSAGE